MIGESSSNPVKVIFVASQLDLLTPALDVARQARPDLPLVLLHYDENQNAFANVRRMRSFLSGLRAEYFFVPLQTNLPRSKLKILAFIATLIPQGLSRVHFINDDFGYERFGYFDLLRLSAGMILCHISRRLRQRLTGSDLDETSRTSHSIRVFFASCGHDRIASAVSAMHIVLADIPLWIVSEFPPEGAQWLRFELGWTFSQNLRNLLSMLSDRRIEVVYVALQPRVPYRRLRLLAMAIAFVRRPTRLYAINEELGIFHVHPLAPGPLVRHAFWRAGNAVRYGLRSARAARHVVTKRTFLELWSWIPLRWSPSDVPAHPNNPVSIFPGLGPRSERPTVLIVSPYIPYPLGHGGAVRIYNLMRRATAWNLVLLCCVDQAQSVPAELLNICSEVVTVVRVGSHVRRMTNRPDDVEEFDVPLFRTALRQACRKWHPQIAQLEFTQMACFASECRSLGVATILVEHDISLDLAAQRLNEDNSWYARQQWKRWNRFERDSWRHVDRVAVMSERDRSLAIPEAVVLPNGVDLHRYQVNTQDEEPGRLLFVGSFRHWPNLIGIGTFVQNVWPLVRHPTRRLHIIAGPEYEHWIRHHRGPIQSVFEAPDITIEGFVCDPRTAYAKAQVVVVPLLVSAGTNIKVLEAMAMGKALVSTFSGVRGLDLSSGDGVVINELGPQMADSIKHLLTDPAERKALGQRGRQIVEERFDWHQIASQQDALYQELIAKHKRKGT